ncbi:4-amino-4-deoxy-L-arabinose-phosphoundecaprenol flippase subunit ArnE [mine drainage metagenome]|uniref:4-amino-4-deoxy-L-arabinose-phosphoundecaprenol flippase subunit ArnE n=1 Tax=mine drainage metagenome TaxID=410659 RepID=A0A1J5RES9_9ZZZZ
MSKLAILVWILNIVVDTVGHMAFKHAAIVEHETEWHRWKKMLTSMPIWVGIVCFCLEFTLWLVLLSILPLSTGVLLGAINMVAIMLAGRVIFRELLDPMRMLGMAFITLGVALVGGFA